MSSWVGWMKWQGNEVANNDRLISYLEAGLGCNVNISLSGEDCRCDAIDEGPYVDPATDDAPWYELAVPESEDFLGVFLTEIRLNGPYSRSVSEAGKDGSVIGRQRVSGRTLSFSGLLVGNTPPGLEYGRRWLAEVLQSCDLGDLCLLPACPGVGIGPDATDAFRTFKRAGLISGPTEVPVGDQRDLVTQFDWQMASEVGWMYSEPEACFDDQVLSGTSQCCQATTESWLGKATVKIVLKSGGPDYVDGVRIFAVPVKTGETCATASATPCLDVTTVNLPPGTELVIDGAERLVQVRRISSGEVIGGMSFLSFEGLWRWPDMGPCVTMCVCAEYTASQVNVNSTLTVEQFNRET